MPTNDERREVAARLREVWVSGCAFVSFFELDCGDFETCQECSEYCTKHLADLIEPEPERTCRNLGKNFTCSECGANVCGGSFRHSYCDSDGTRWYTTKNPPNWNYCPNCGAKVVE